MHRIARRTFLKSSLVAGAGMFSSHPLFSHTVEKRSAVLRAGAATSNITPMLSVPMDGTIMQIGPAVHVHDELFARCLVLDDDTTKLAFAVVDNTMISDEIHNMAKQLIERHTGIPPANVLISATHSHSTPRAMTGLRPNSTEHKDYLDYLPIRISDGVRRAVNNLAPAKIGWGSSDDPRHVFNRRWFLKDDVTLTNPFGDTTERISMNPARDKIQKPAGPVDPEVFVLAVQHADGRPLALLANYGLHYVGGIQHGTISADYFGAFADIIKQRLGAEGQDPPFVGIMSNGTSGDVNANNLAAPPETFPPYERMKLVADHIAQTVERIYNELDWHAYVSLASASVTLALGVRKPDADRLKWANANPVAPDQHGRLTRGQIYAREALALHQYPDTVSVPLQAFRIGDLAIGAIPNEVFAETGLAIKAQSPFSDNTFVIELANGFHGYLPSSEQHAGGGYETWPARSSYLEVGGEAKIRSSILRLLEKLKKYQD
jgi:neutral ceramidase